jgi:hypothetical protein
MMERSSRFISLSGVSGIIAGVIALIAAWVGNYFIRSSGEDFGSMIFNPSLVQKLMITCLLTLLAAIFFGILFTIRKSKKKNLKIWNGPTRRLLVSMFVPLLAGGIFCLVLSFNAQFHLVAPAMLIFYGLALISSSKFTFSDIEYLGYCQLALGIIALFMVNYGLIFWALGFGVLHIIYGFMMQKKYH